MFIYPTKGRKAQKSPQRAEKPYHRVLLRRKIMFKQRFLKGGNHE